jgi:hypothetical protein
MHVSCAHESNEYPSASTVEPTQEAPSVHKMQGHWVLATAGKRVLRPGGLALTRHMLDALAIGPQDRVVEFAPGLGVTARMVLKNQPSAYWGVEREPAAAEYLQRQLANTVAQIVQGEAQKSGLPKGCASVVYGEAMLSMQGPEQKNRIFTEACRLLASRGRYGIHELCLLPDDVSPSLRREIQAELSKEIHVGAQLLSRADWAAMFAQNGMSVTWSYEAPMQLLEPGRMLKDEGLSGSLRIALNMLTKPALRHRILTMRRLFRKYEKHLGAISIIGTLREG